ncbi:MAG: nuclear transport factor 2 family protein [Proteobacteria bacterium]|nr:nuclear transport factor 2 family protein [Pseudomonadota bacterium]MDA1057638.1 nuclear transport factor 2 family protein [Pseudomonadota bacterium]
MSLQDDIGAVIESLEVAWKAHDFAAVKALWDTDDPQPIYIAEEAEKPFTTWPEIDRYWSHTAGVLARVSHRAANRIIKAASPDIAIVLYDMHWNAEVAPGGLFGGEKMAGDNRVSIMLRRKPEGWRIFHYVEAPVAGMVQMRQAMRALVDPGF